MKAKTKTISQINSKIKKYTKGCNERFSKLELQLELLTQKIELMETDNLLSRNS